MDAPLLGLPNRVILRPPLVNPRKGVRCCSLGLLVCLLLTGVYIPLFYTLTFRQVALQENDAPNFQWNSNTTRDIAVYVQPSNITAIIANPNFCDSPSNDLFLVIVVCSSVENFTPRMAIRETWASFQHNKSSPSPGHLDIRVAFLLGETSNSTLQEEVLEESRSFGDVIQEGFRDSYLNLTLKSVMLLKWVSTYCPETKFVFKTDDDMYVNVGELVRYLLLPANVGRNDLIGGSLFCHSKPIKDRHSKWYSPQFMFQGKEYPDYVSGTGYVMSGALVPRLLNASLEVPLFHLEDIFVTGLVAQKIKVVPENYNLFTYYKHALNQTCLYRHIITSHGLTPSEIHTVWRDATNPGINCTAYKLPKIGEPKLKKCVKTRQKASGWFARRNG